MGGDASNHQGAPVPPVRSSSAQQSNNGPFQQGSRTTGRRTGPAPAPPIQRPSRPPPMRPPTQPPPPPPVTNHPGGRNQSSHPSPPPPPMQHQVKVTHGLIYVIDIGSHDNLKTMMPSSNNFDLYLFSSQVTITVIQTIMHQLHPQERPRSDQEDREEVIKTMVARSRLALQACLKLLNFYRLLNHS